MSVKFKVASIVSRARAIARRPMVREGARDAAPMAIGIAAWGLVAGVAMAKSGMGVPLAILMSVLVYAGSAQIAALPLIVADAPMWVVWATATCVSLRFIAFSFHYRPYFAHLPRRRRIVLSYFMGDTNFALFMRRFPEPCRGHGQVDYFLGSAIMTYGVWQVAIITGIVAGHAIPADVGHRFRRNHGAAGADLHPAAQPFHVGGGRGRRVRCGGGLRPSAAPEHRGRIAAAVAVGALADHARPARAEGDAHEPVGDLPHHRSAWRSSRCCAAPSSCCPRATCRCREWLREGLHYAPIAALAAVVAPELVMTQGHLIDTWRDARIFGALAGLAFYRVAAQPVRHHRVRHRRDAGAAVWVGLVGATPSRGEDARAVVSRPANVVRRGVDDLVHPDHHRLRTVARSRQGTGA